MTNEEASNVLDDYDVNFDGHTAEEIAEAFDVAFKALQQESCEDAISKEAAKSRIKQICRKYNLAYEDGERKVSTGGSAYELGHAFDDLPPVTPARSKGEWISYRRYLIPDDKFEKAWRCSNCRYGDQDDGDSAWLEWKFCPNCGSDNRGDAE